MNCACVLISEERAFKDASNGVPGEPIEERIIVIRDEKRQTVTLGRDAEVQNLIVHSLGRLDCPEGFFEVDVE